MQASQPAHASLPRKRRHPNSAMSASDSTELARCAARKIYDQCEDKTLLTFGYVLSFCDSGALLTMDFVATILLDDVGVEEAIRTQVLVELARGMYWMQTLKLLTRVVQKEKWTLGRRLLKLMPQIAGGSPVEMLVDTMMSFEEGLRWLSRLSHVNPKTGAYFLFMMDLYAQLALSPRWISKSCKSPSPVSVMIFEHAEDFGTRYNHWRKFQDAIGVVAMAMFVDTHPSNPKYILTQLACAATGPKRFGKLIYHPVFSKVGHLNGLRFTYADCSRHITKASLAVMMVQRGPHQTLDDMDLTRDDWRYVRVNCMYSSTTFYQRSILQSVVDARCRLWSPAHRHKLPPKYVQQCKDLFKLLYVAGIRARERFLPTDIIHQVLQFVD